MNDILNCLNSLYPDAKCELIYHKDYELLIAVMLSAQTTDKRVNKVTNVLFSKYDSLEKLVDANLNDISNIVRELGNYTKKSKAIIDISKSLLTNYNGVVPNNRIYLESLPMVGRKTTSVVLANLFNVPNIAVDTHVSRVSKRLGLAKEKDDVIKVEKKLKKFFPKASWIKVHHQLVLFGRYRCKAIKPECNLCRLSDICKYKKRNN
jgi:endonuclease-3